MEFPGLGPPGTWRIRGPWNGTAALRQGPVAHGTRAGNMGWLMGYGLEEDIRYCLTANTANVLPIFKDGRLVIK